MTEPYEPEVPERSGDTVAEAVEVAADGTQHDGVLRPPEESTPGTSPVEQTYDDPHMTEGAEAAADDVPGPRVPETRMPEAPVAGGAQSAPSARIPDRVSAADEEAGT